MTISDLLQMHSDFACSEPNLLDLRSQSPMYFSIYPTKRSAQTVCFITSFPASCYKSVASPLHKQHIDDVVIQAVKHTYFNCGFIQNFSQLLILHFGHNIPSRNTADVLASTEPLILSQFIKNVLNLSMFHVLS